MSNDTGWEPFDIVPWSTFATHEPFLYPWIHAIALRALLGLTLIHPTLRSLKRYRAIMIIIFLLGYWKAGIGYSYPSSILVLSGPPGRLPGLLLRASRSHRKPVERELLWSFFSVNQDLPKPKWKWRRKRSILKRSSPLVGEGSVWKEGRLNPAEPKTYRVFFNPKNKSRISTERIIEKSLLSPCCLQNRQCRCLRRCRSSRRLLNPLGSNAHNNHKVTSSNIPR